MDLVDELIEFCNTDLSDKPISLGPWGGMGGANWSFNEDGTKVIRKMEIFYKTDLINAIVFTYEINGKLEKINIGGDTRNLKKQEIDLDFPRKYLTDISGSVDRYIISLKIVTNDTDTEHKPIGAHGKGSPFTLPVHNGMIVGFHGRCGACINSIGVYVMKDTNKTGQVKPIRIGPWGGNGGSDWTFNETGIAAIKQIKIFLGNANISIAFKQELDGETSNSETFGDPDSSQTYKIDLDWPREYIISISGYVKEYVTSLKIVTNVKEHEPYGPEQGFPFTLPMQGGRIVGFHGRCSPYLNSIGVYIKEDKIKVVQDLPVRLGPWGADGGEKWTFNEKNAVINQIVIRCGNDAIDSIAFQYELDGQIISTKRFGGVGGREYKINLGPQEYLTDISGRWSSFTTVLGNTEYRGVTDMKVSTNKKEHGPFGSKEGKGVHFAVPIEGKILGFHGRSSNYLNAIGVYMKP